MAVTLTPEELEVSRALKAQGRRPDEIFNTIAASRTGLRTAESYNTPLQGGGPSETQRDFGETLGAIKDSGSRFVSNFSRAFTDQTPGITPIDRFNAAAVSVPKLAVDVAGDAFTGGLKMAVGQETEDRVSGAISSGVSAAAQTNFAQGIKSWYENQSPDAQFRISQVILPLGEVVSEVGTGGIFGRVLNRGRRAATSPEQIEQAVNNAAREAGQGNTAPATRIANATLEPEVRQQAVDNLARTYMSSLVENRQAINNKLDTLAEEQSRPDAPLTRDDLIRNLANEGYIPIPEGRIARFNESLADVQSRQRTLMQDMERVLEQVQTTADTKAFYDSIRASLRNDPRVGSDINTALRRIDDLEKSSRTRFGNTLTAQQINDLKVEGNQKRSDVGRQGNDPIQTDVWANQARASNEWLNSNISDDLFRRTNAEWARLNTLRETMDALKNQQINVGILGSALGSYMTLIAGSAIGLSAGGAGALVIAGILSKIGADTIADMLRRRAFNPEATQVIREVMRNDDTLREELLRTATNMETRNTLDNFVRALPAPAEGAPRSQVSSGPTMNVGGETPAGRVESGITERTREGAIQRSDSEPRQSVAEEAITRDKIAVEQALLEMEVEVSERPQVDGQGGNMVKNTEGEYYRFRSIPVWVPERFRDGALLDRVMRNVSEGRQPRANATNEQELQKVVEEYIAERAEVIRNTPTDSSEGVFSADTAFAVALMVGGTYYVTTKDGELAPVIGMAAMMANPQARKMLADQAASGKLQKLPDADRDAIQESLRVVDMNQLQAPGGRAGGSTVDFGDIEELDRLKAAMEDPGGMTDADFIEARALLEKYNIPFNQGATPQTTSFDPKNFKTAEEYVKAQKPLYHGTNSGFDTFDAKKVGSNTGESNAIGTFFAESTKDVDAFKKTLTEGFGRGETRDTSNFRTVERFLPPDAKMFNLNLSGRGVSINQAELLAKLVGSESGEVLTGMQAKAYIDELIDESVPGDGIREVIFENADEFKRLLSEEGYIGYTDVMGQGAKEFVIFDPNSLKTRAQLIDEWEKANE